MATPNTTSAVPAAARITKAEGTILLNQPAIEQELLENHRRHSMSERRPVRRCLRMHLRFVEPARSECFVQVEIMKGAVVLDQRCELLMEARFDLRKSPVSRQPGNSGAAVEVSAKLHDHKSAVS